MDDGGRSRRIRCERIRGRQKTRRWSDSYVADRVVDCDLLRQTKLKEKAAELQMPVVSYENLMKSRLIGVGAADEFDESRQLGVDHKPSRSIKDAVEDDKRAGSQLRQ